MAKVKKKSTKKKNDESSIYSGVAINIADDCKTSKKMVKDWTKIMNNNANLCTMIRKRKTNRKINFSLSR